MIEKPLKLELKKLSKNLIYAFLVSDLTYLIIISSSLIVLEEEKLLRMLRKHKSALGWSIYDIKRISSSIVMKKILMEESDTPSIER